MRCARLRQVGCFEKNINTMAYMNVEWVGNAGWKGGKFLLLCSDAFDAFPLQNSRFAFLLLKSNLFWRRKKGLSIMKVVKVTGRFVILQHECLGFERRVR